MALDIGRKGQVSIEFILIVTIALFYITTVVWPIVNESTAAAEDVQGVSATKISAMKIANALNESKSSSGDMKKTMSISLPNEAKISGITGTDTIVMNVNVAPNGGNPDEMNCVNGDLEGDPPTPINYICTSTVNLITGAGTTFNISGPAFKDFAVKKTNGVISAGWSQ